LADLPPISCSTSDAGAVERRRIDAVRVIVLGVMPDYRHTGVAARLYQMHFDAAERTPQKGGEMGWTLEVNEGMNRALEGMGAEITPDTTSTNARSANSTAQGRMPPRTAPAYAEAENVRCDGERCQRERRAGVRGDLRALRA
jgi:GNAT superfamily N-acetyltransferase